MIGTSLGPYRIDAELGSGGMGKVYAATVEGRAHGLAAGERVALKVVHPSLLEAPGFFKRFLREAEIGKAVAHENVVRTHDVDAIRHEGDQLNFLVMEYVEGQNLAELVTEIDRAPEELCRHIGREVAKGLAAIHAAGVVHRDLKPENVLITEEHVVKVMDLGIARLVDEAIRLSQTGSFVGSVQYAAPEQFRSATDVDHRTDLHALGAVLYELASGRPPFAGDEFRAVMHQVLMEEPRRLGEVNPQVSPFFEEIVHKLLAKDMADRFQSAGELLQVLQQGEPSPWWRRRARQIQTDTNRPLRRVHIPRETAVYGRESDLETLRGLYDRARGGDGQIVLIEGEAGIGKTRLVDEFVARLRADGEEVNFLFGSYPPAGAATAAGAFATAYLEQFGGGDLEATLARYLTVTPLLVPAFAALLNGDATPHGKEPLTKESLQTVFVHATRGLAAERPTVVLIDDLHFAPADGRSLFAALSLALPGHRVLLVGTARPGLPDEWTSGLERPDHASSIVLERLFPKDLVNLLEDTLRSNRLAEKLAGRIALKSDGVPFFVFEILNGLREGDYLKQGEDGSWITTQVIRDIEIPSSVQDLIQARVADLEEEDRDLLDVAACCGFEFDPGLVASALDMRRIPALKRFGRMEKTHRLIRSAGRLCVFDHHQVQESLYAGLLEQLREEYHAAIAEALEERENAADCDPADLDGDLAVTLCRHFLYGGRGKQGLRYLGPALDRLEASYQNGNALALTDGALAVPRLLAGTERMELLLRKAMCLEHLGRPSEERAALDEAVALADASGDEHAQALARQRLGMHLQVNGPFEEADAVLREAVLRAEQDGLDDILAKATNSQGSVCVRTGDYERAHNFFERALKAFPRSDDRHGEAMVLANLGILLFLEGRLDEARARVRRSLEINSELGNRRGIAAALGSLASIVQTEGAFDEAAKLNRRRLEICREIGYRRGEGSSLANLSGLMIARGRLEEADTYTRGHLAITRETGFRISEGLGLTNLGLITSMLGGADARACLDRALERARTLGAKRLEGFTLAHLGDHEIRRHHTDEGFGFLLDALDIGREIGETHLMVHCLLSLGSLEDQPTAARRERMDEAVKIARDSGIHGVEVRALAHLATLRDGDPAPALAALAEHEERMEIPDLLDARFALYRATSDTAHLADAHRHLEYLREHAPEDARDAMLTNVALHHDVAAAWAMHGPDGD